ncbi:hypothetical protein N7G274_002435 [Stereocaulon virgatum]|uniref:Uncharacterized protein n=1 Tax=Stereocaulon virgatum TaxID=373712 RepID=A0ABR4AII4_9LECA
MEDQEDYNQVARVPEATDHPCQPGPIKLNLLTRPLSSHEDLDAGFSFTKAKPRQQLDFSRKPKQSTDTHANEASTSLPPAAEALPFRTSPPASNITKPTQSKISATNPPKQASHEVTLLAVPFPNVYSPAPSEHVSTAEDPTACVGSPPSKLPINEASTSAEDTLGGPNSNEVNHTHHQYIHETYHAQRSSPRGTSHNPEHFTQETYDALGCFVNEIPHHSENAPQKPTTMRSRPSLAAIPASRVTKNRKKKVTVQGNNGGAVTSHRFLPTGETNEDMLLLLMNRIRQDRRERDATQAALEASNRQCQMFAALSSDLDARLHDTTKLCSEKEAQLSKIKAARPGWETKIKKLSEYVQGLTNDHNRLRDDARNIREQSSIIFKEKKCLHDALQEMSQMTTEQGSKSRKLVIEARRDLEMLQRKVQHQQSDIHNKQELLVAERAHNIQLEGQISDFAAGAARHEYLAGLLLGHRDVITRKIDEFLEKADFSKAATPGESQDHLRLMLEQCLTVLTNLKVHDAAKPDKYDKLQDSMRGYFDSITQSIESCAQNSTTMIADHQQLASLMQEQLRDLRSKLAADINFNEQLMDLREVKATLRERLQGTDSALRDARVESIALKQKVEDQQRKILTLEADVAQKRDSTEEVVTLLRLQELDSQNKVLQQSIAGLQTENVSLLEQMQQMKAKRSPVDNKLSHATKQVIILQSEKEKFEKKEASTLKLSLERLQEDRQHEAAFADRLRARVADLEKQNIEQTATNESLREELAGNNEDIKAKDGYIEHLHAREKGPQAAQDKQPQQSPTGPRSELISSAPGPSRSTHFTIRALSAVLEDSQPDGPLNNVEEPVTEADLDLLSVSPPARTEISRIPNPSLQQNGKTTGNRVQIFRSLKEQPKNTHLACSGPDRMDGASSGQHKFNVSTIPSNNAVPKTVELKYQAGALQPPARGSAVTPRGVVKDPREGKRDASGAGFNDAGKGPVSKRARSSMTRAVTVIADSQSPPHSSSNRTRTQTKTTKKASKDNQMKNRFSQELRRSVDR